MQHSSFAGKRGLVAYDAGQLEDLARGQRPDLRCGAPAVPRAVQQHGGVGVEHLLVGRHSQVGINQRGGREKLYSPTDF